MQVVAIKKDSRSKTLIVALLFGFIHIIIYTYDQQGSQIYVKYLPECAVCL